MNQQDKRSIDTLLGIMAVLRDPVRGCPWDREQDFGSIAPYTIEEAYEVADAIERRHWDDLRSELGDLLLQAVYHAQMAEEAGHFTFEDVARGVADKMVDRHRARLAWRANTTAALATTGCGVSHESWASVLRA